MKRFFPTSVLITQGELMNYAGSEIVALELAEYFSQKGSTVQVLTNYIGAPIAKEFRKLKNVSVQINPSKINYENLDLVWVHHQLIPQQILDLAQQQKLHAKIVFHHMSPYHPLEFPFAPRVEQYLADLILFNSHETQKAIESKLSTIKFYGELMNNPAPDFYYNPKQTVMRSDAPKNILVVSNHSLDELIDIIKIAELEGLSVRRIGGANWHDQRRVNAKDLEWADVVLSIGKTVQYGVVSGVPVYCYDQFGGPGYLSKSNFKRAAELNFSGRGFAKKRPRVVVKEIMNGYRNAHEFAQYARRTYAEDYLLSRKMDFIFDSLEHRTSSDRGRLPQEDRAAFDALSERVWNAHRTLCNLTASYDRQSRAYDALQKEHEKFAAALEGVFASISWRITTPLRRINKGFRNKNLNK